MRHLRAINQKASRVEQTVAAPPAGDVVALQQGSGLPQQPEGPHIPLGCSLVFQPGWEADRNGGTAGLCQPVERDLFDCHRGCFWPAHVPDQAQPHPRLDRQVRRRPEGLAQHRPDLSVGVCAVATAPLSAGGADSLRGFIGRPSEPQAAIFGPGARASFGRTSTHA